ncbi:major vault protein-like isoform X2 [Acanthaster planci]|uniref:Major vault protein n=1 Tax=Acanthaster planci TaxID=133434 RepID=A0A8B7XKF2_ACAPL|nr:major vault protein-like isoform X2 [Acanthaster planci]
MSNVMLPVKKETNITRLEVGPQRLMLLNNEKLVAGPIPCVIVPPGHYCRVKDPMSHYEEGVQCELKHGQVEIRFYQEPFPLYPGEKLESAENLQDFSSRGYRKAMHPLPVVKVNQAIQLKAVLDHEVDGVQRQAGDLWQLEGPLTYKPTAEAEIVGWVNAAVIGQGQALHLRATQGFTDKGITRVSGEEWLVRKAGAYLPGVYEEVVELVSAYILKQDVALHLIAEHNCQDALGRQRQAGEEWMVTADDTEMYIPEIGEQAVKSVKKTVLEKGQYCIVCNPVDEDGHSQLGCEELRKGHTSFFLHPGESIKSGIQEQFVLSEDQAIVLQAISEFEDNSIPGEPQMRISGDRWMIHGPISYIPPVQVQVIDQGDGALVRRAIPLNDMEGIYVRNLKTGEVRAVMGPDSYLLTEHEQLWEKELPSLVLTILQNGGGCGSGDIRKLAYFESSIDADYAPGKIRDKTRVVRFRCPGNTAVQVYKYQEKTARVVFGPDMVILGPQEDFNVLSLSAGKPKVENALQTICLMLGPDYITDILEVETSDHARLKVRIAFNNYFEFERGNKLSEEAIFSVPDFIGFACRQVGSRIRGAVSRVRFDEFHRHSSKILQGAVFGFDADGNVKNRLKFKANHLVISNVDIQGIEPVDLTMRDSLIKSVQMAIEISTKSIERAAAHDAARKEQESQGLLERQKLLNEKEAEQERAKLFELQAEAAAIESTGQAKAEAQARAESLLIECHSAIDSARLKAQAEEVIHDAELQTQNLLRMSELSYKRRLNEAEIKKAIQLCNIEVSRFDAMVKALGGNTIIAIASAGPKLQAELMEGLGIESTLMNGNNPINLFKTTKEMIAGN